MAQVYLVNLSPGREFRGGGLLLNQTGRVTSRDDEVNTCPDFYSFPITSPTGSLLLRNKKYPPAVRGINLVVGGLISCTYTGLDDKFK